MITCLICFSATFFVLDLKASGPRCLYLICCLENDQVCLYWIVRATPFPPAPLIPWWFFSLFYLCFVFSQILFSSSASTTQSSTNTFITCFLSLSSTETYRRTLWPHYHGNSSRICNSSSCKSVYTYHLVLWTCAPIKTFIKTWYILSVQPTFIVSKWIPIYLH